MCGFQDIELTWFKSYLHDSQELVSFQPEISEYLDIKWRTARFSVIVPILFLVFINDIFISL